jgi:hypothetical protein
MQHLEGSGTLVLYIGRTVLKGQDHQTAARPKRRWSVEVDVTGTVADYEVRIHLAHDQVQ